MGSREEAEVIGWRAISDWMRFVHKSVCFEAAIRMNGIPVQRVRERKGHQTTTQIESISVSINTRNHPSTDSVPKCLGKAMTEFTIGGSAAMLDNDSGAFVRL